MRQQDMQLVYTGTAADGTDCYYVFALQPTGFVIVSADERVKPILGYSYTNNFVVEDMPINVISWLDNYKKQIKAVVDNNYQADPGTKTTWIRLKAGQSTTTRSGNAVEPLLQTNWNQNCYYNQLCPVDSSGPCNRVYAGCVATAMAQVMHYWEWPTQGFNSHSYTCDYGTLSVDFSTATYNHNNMPNVVNYSTSAAQKEEVARLIYHCGVAVDMDYGPDGSGAYSSNVPAALYNYFAYTDNGTYVYKSSYSETNWANLIKQELDNLRPVYYSGHGTGGHAFVCDGYDENGLFHFNWGWSGSNDGYFDLSTLNPSTHDFSSSQAAVIGVKSAGTFMRCSDTELSFSARVGEQSAPQTIMVCGHGLSGSISVSVGSGFKVSKNGSYYYSSLTLPASGGKLYVKYIPTQAGDVSDSLTLTSGNYSLTVSLYGTDKVIVGSGTATSNFLPSHSYYKYALTQQIYTPEEIGISGYINSIAFFNDGTEKIRNYNMYLVLTDKDTFASSTDWIAVTEDDMVFSGEVTMAAGTWTTFNFNNFAYDGVSNLALIMDDNTGSYSSGMACRVFDAENKSLYVYSDGTNYDPANPYSYSGTILDKKNQLKIGITPATVVICEKPSNLTFSNLTPTSVSVSWNGGSGNYGYEYRRNTDTEWTVACPSNCGNNCNLYGLTPNTDYLFRVRSFCDNDTSKWVSSSFSTPAGIPLIEPFDNSTKPTGWALYTGLLSNVIDGTASLVSVTSGWTFGNGNGVFDSHARTNIYGSTWNKWLVTPTLLMEDSVELRFDLALTKYSGTLQPVVDTLQQDDKFIVLITTDYGTTWKVLRQWDNTGSEYVYNNIVCSATGEKVIIDLSSFAGQNIAIAFYGESTATGGDNNLHIDNVSIDYIPFCPMPTELNVIYYSGNTAGVLWDGDAESYHLYVNDEMYETTSSPYVLTGLESNTTYIVRVQADCGDGLYSEWTDSISFTTDDCSAIALNADNNFIWEDDFESYTTSTTASTGVEPTCWVLVQEDVPMSQSKKPQLCYKSSYAHSGNYSLKLNYRGIYAMPNLSLPEEFSMSQVVMKMYLRQPNAVYQLEVGVLEENGTFVPVTLINNSTTDIEYVVCDFSNYTGNGHRIAFHNVLDNNVNISYSLNYIDDIVLSLPVCGAITLPYSETFEDITGVTTANTGVEPDCWELVQEDVTMPASKRPQLYYKSDFAHSGSYSLLLNYRGVYAMPAMADELSMQDVKLEMYVRQPKAAYQLQVGVWDDTTNAFTPVALFNNTTTGVEKVMCDFSGYTGNGRRIAFRNVLGSGNYAYSYNYLDDITLTLKETEDCTLPLQQTETFEDYTTVTTTVTGVEPDCWELVMEEVQMPDSKKPQLYYRSDFAHSGDYSLLLNYRCVYAMPNLDAADANISDLHLSMYLRQPNAAYMLEVGVWEPNNDPEQNESGVFVPVHVFNNKTTDLTFVECDFSNYTGDGGRIAFRNTLSAGKTWNYSYNYIDDVNLTPITNKSAGVTNANTADAGILGADRDMVDIVVYPNPTKDYVNVQCTMYNEPLEMKGIEVIDVYGKVVRTVVGANNYSPVPTQINVSGLAAGMYFVRVTTEEGMVTKAFVKR